ncbi:hypothetical protein B7494_g985 [Chlorociboria aeruginascens]|nr:hypothetical protein B7494_g985 [Chlorociboria aeruginascens]
MRIPKPRILFIDAYDSFSNNIISLLSTTLSCTILAIKIDNPILLNSDEALHSELRHYAAVICGPGPGHPGSERDVGIMKKIWRLGEKEMIPALGICLGFQSLCLEFGGNVKRLKGPQHGIIRRVRHVGEMEGGGKESIFEGVGEVHATLYQSLCADIGQDSVSATDWDSTKWDSPRRCPELIPLAWVEEKDCVGNDSGVKDNRVLVAVRHTTKPFWALQYHPESICTNDESKKVIKNWFRQAQRWNRASGRKQVDLNSLIVGESSTRESLLRRYNTHQLVNGNLVTQSKGDAEAHRNISDMYTDYVYYSRKITLPDHISIPDLVEAIQAVCQNCIILESSNAHEKSSGSADVRGRYSIIGLDVNDALRFEYRASSDLVTAIWPKFGHGYREMGSCSEISLQPFGGIWPFLAQFLDKRRIVHGDDDSLFWGGFMGYTTYELGLESINIKCGTRNTPESRPDLSFTWVTRSIVVDHLKGIAHIQQLVGFESDGESGWIEYIGSKLVHLFQSKSIYRNNTQSLQSSKPPTSTPKTNGASNHPNGKSHPTNGISKHSKIIIQPTNATYERKVRLCQESIFSGDSYELCLTSQTTIRQPRSSLKSPSWDLYKTLRTHQPSPFASYLRLGSATLISSSPERFLSWTRDGLCELRPMKGTVRKSPQISTLAQATALLGVPKEKAENLMIVDLVRHDLYSVCGAEYVCVPRLMAVEEYRSVFQMISIVQGQIPCTGKEMETKEKYTGLDVLAASLPPGSMTGAPKKRSCEILQGIEDTERSLYSGVVGYMDVGGRGDFSVTIRSMFRWDDEDTPRSSNLDDKEVLETWHIGAGGAVTALSTPIGEREEMQTKLFGTLGVFDLLG